MKDSLIAGCVVFYNPDDSAVENILTYLPKLGRLYIVDNSDTKFDVSIFSNINTPITYIYNGKNLGIASALNSGITAAGIDGFKLILTMDQDSKFCEGDFELYLNSVAQFEDPLIGMVTPFHNVGLGSSKNKEKFTTILTAMTSGNILSISHFLAIGGFIENLFIDYVDHEFCLRLNKSNIKVIQNNMVNLVHKLGDTKAKKMLFFSLSYTNHNHIRRYFMTRNRLYVIKKYLRHYPLLCLRDFKDLFVEFAKILLFEENKLKKTKSIVLGIRDFLISRYGPYRYGM